MRSAFTPLFLVVAFALPHFSHAQDTRLTMSGVVTDNKTHLPVEGAKVTLDGNKANPEVTDRDGTFILHLSAEVRGGAVARIRVEKAGYKVYEANKAVSSVIPLPISLEPLLIPSKAKGASSTNISLPGASPIENLARLGWGIKENGKGIIFEIAAAPLPDMKQSAAYFQGVQKAFQLHFQQVPSIAGMELLTNKNCVGVEISASNIESTLELRNLTGLRSLSISQTPFNDSRHELDISGIGLLGNLENLNLNMSRVSSLESIRGLAKLASLNVGGTLVRDLSPISGLTGLKTLDVRDSRVTDLSILSGDNALEEVSVDEKQVTSLSHLSRLSKLNRLTIISNFPVDTAAVGTLQNLESLFIWGPPLVDLSPIRKLDSLTNLDVSGVGFGMGRTQVLGVDAIGELTHLRNLTIGAAQITSLEFLTSRNHQLVQLNLRDVPIMSVAGVTSLTSLKEISLTDVPVIDISPLLSLPNLEKLSLLRTPARADVISELERRGVKVILN